MHKLKEKFMDELYELEEKAGKTSSRISEGDLNKIHKLTDTIKNIDKIEALESGDGYSEESNWMADGRVYGMSNARGRGRYAKRDSMGRYSSEGGSYEGGSYDDGESYARGRGGRGYSRNDGYSRGEDMVERLEDMMNDANSEKEREAIRRCLSQLKNM